MDEYQIEIRDNHVVINNIIITFYKKDYDLESYDYKTCDEKKLYIYSEQKFYVSNESDKDRIIFRYTNKHSNYLFKECKEVDVSDIKWLENVELKSSNKSQEIQDLLDMGENAYLQSIETSQEEYLADLDYRLSLVELGVN